MARFFKSAGGKYLIKAGPGSIDEMTTKSVYAWNDPNPYGIKNQGEGFKYSSVEEAKRELTGGIVTELFGKHRIYVFDEQLKLITSFMT